MMLFSVTEADDFGAPRHSPVSSDNTVILGNHAQDESIITSSVIRSLASEFRYDGHLASLFY